MQTEKTIKEHIATVNMAVKLSDRIKKLKLELKREGLDRKRRLDIEQTIEELKMHWREL